MFAEAISGFVFLLIAIFLAPLLIVNAFAKITGQRLKFPSVMKLALDLLMGLALRLLETAEVVAQMVADRVPAKQAHLRPVVSAVVFMLIIAVGFLLLLRVLAAMASI